MSHVFQHSRNSTAKHHDIIWHARLLAFCWQDAMEGRKDFAYDHARATLWDWTAVSCTSNQHTHHHTCGTLLSDLAVSPWNPGSAVPLRAWPLCSWCPARWTCHRCPCPLTDRSSRVQTLQAQAGDAVQRPAQTWHRFGQLGKHTKLYEHTHFTWMSKH